MHKETVTLSFTTTAEGHFLHIFSQALLCTVVGLEVSKEDYTLEEQPHQPRHSNLLEEQHLRWKESPQVEHSIILLHIGFVMVQAFHRVQVHRL